MQERLVNTLVISLFMVLFPADLTWYAAATVLVLLAIGYQRSTPAVETVYTGTGLPPSTRR